VTGRLARGGRFGLRALAGIAGWCALAVLPVAAAAPASAHSTTLPDAAYYRSTVTSVTPAVPGLEVRVARSGETVTLTNHTGKMVVVLGYQGEDYLRLSPSGVEENTNSLSAALNGSLVVEGLPAQLGQSGKPAPAAWSHVADTPAFSWHDHRVHWMAQQRPAVVAADPAEAHRVLDWAIDLRVGSAPATVRGTLTWIGKPGITGIPLLLLEGLGAAAGIALVLLLVREYVRSRAARAARPDSSEHDASGLDDGPFLPKPARSRLLDR
jgi:hypothetical protein